jgi:hypothetical protein
VCVRITHYFFFSCLEPSSVSYGIFRLKVEFPENTEIGSLLSVPIWCQAKGPWSRKVDHKHDPMPKLKERASRRAKGEAKDSKKRPASETAETENKEAEIEKKQKAAANGEVTENDSTMSESEGVDENSPKQTTIVPEEVVDNVEGFTITSRFHQD